MKHPQFQKFDVGIGATDELSLRVSVGALVRVLFRYPADGELILALERKATLLESETGHVVAVKSQPFGGALRLLDPIALQRQIGEFHFDSQESRAEQDFRIFIQPSQWETVREFCSVHFRQPDNPVLESDPGRELAEEFADALGINLKRDQYVTQARGVVVEDKPSPTEYVHAKGYPTARIYRIFEARILDSSLASAMIENSESCSDEELRELAIKDSQQGGPGRANAVLTLPFQELTAFYSSIPQEARNKPVSFHNHQIDETAAAVLEGVTVPKYGRL